MFKTTSQNLLPRQGDPRKFAQQGILLQGLVPIASLPRLVDAIEESSGEIQVDLVFGFSEDKKKIVTGSARADISLVCQRCLNPVTVLVESSISLGIVWDEEHALALPEYLDPWIAGEGAADFYEMIEEEMLLSLPAVAYHQEPCVNNKLFESGKPVEVKKEKNPFQVLEQLKSSPK
ncbi:MAG: YceD family protein [Pseudomonadota bacterium]